MSDTHRIPPTSYRSSIPRTALRVPVLLALGALLLALPVHGSGMALTTTVTIGDNGSDTVEYVTITNRSGTSCQFTVSKWSEPPGGFPTGLGEMPVQWDISSANCSVLLVDLDFGYTDAELAAGNSVTEGRLRPFQYVSAGTWADRCVSPCSDPPANTVSVSDVTSLGDWTIGDLGSGYPSYPGPTTVTVRGPALGGGFDESALVLGLSVLTGVGLILGWRLRKPAG